jgi:hypothetical protein
MASQFAEHGRRAWASDEPCWGIWSIPESDLNVLSDVAGMDAVERGCGTAYWLAWLARAGALLDSSGLEIRDLIELQGPEGGSFGQGDFVTLEWARRWPSEEIWRARKR